MRVDYSCTSDSSAMAVAVAPVAAASLAPQRVAPVLALVCLVATSYVRPLHTIVFSVEAV